jgi:hypothetical protein
MSLVALGLSDKYDYFREANWFDPDARDLGAVGFFSFSFFFPSNLIILFLSRIVS